MKKIKRILASVMVLAMVLAVAPAAFATEYTGEGNALTDVTWTSGAMYIVTIPATVALGNTATISASNVRLSVGETLNVRLTGTSDADNAFKLTSGSNELTYTVSKGTDNVAVGDVILSVPAGTATGEQTLTFNEPATAPNAGDYTGTVTFTISVAAATVPVTGVAITNAPTELTKGDTGTFTANVTPDDATDKTVTWSSSDTSILTVNATTGAYEAIAAGTATITATAGGQSATCTVTVKIAWNADVLQGWEVIERDGITLTPSNGDARSDNSFYDYGTNTFTAPNGTNFKKIEIVCSAYRGGWSGATEEVIGSDQSDPDEAPDWEEDIIKVTWTGDSPEVSFTSDIFGVQSITFTLG